jgi:flagellar biosynthesis protein FlhG
MPHGRATWLAVVGGKGGVGKTHVAASLAYSWSTSGDRVLLVDADLGMGNVEILLGLRPRFDIGDAMAGRCSLEDVVIEGPGGVHVLPASSGSHELSTLATAERLRLVAALTHLGHGYQHVILDVGAGIGPLVLFFQGLAARTLLVTSPEPTALTDAYAFVKVAHRINGTARFQLLVNQSRDANEAVQAKRVLEDLARRFLGVAIDDFGAIPFDVAVGQAVRMQHVVVDAKPEAPAAHALERLARALLSHGAGAHAPHRMPGKAR